METLHPPSTRPIIAWSDVLVLGHPQIDADHRRIFDIAERMHADIHKTGEDLLVRQVLVELSEYTITHFAHEEALMKAAGFPGREEHRFEHELIIYRLRNLQRQATNGCQGMADKLEIFLDRWLARHILTSDAQFAAMLRDKQVC